MMSDWLWGRDALLRFCRSEHPVVYQQKTCSVKRVDVSRLATRAVRRACHGRELGSSFRDRTHRTQRKTLV